jgi:sec-independent protein translocase protein TatA
MGPIGWPELIILLVVVLIVFGPGKLPDIGNAIGRGVREFRKASNDLEESIRGDTKQKPPASPPTSPPVSTPAPDRNDSD